MVTRAHGPYIGDIIIDISQCENAWWAKSVPSDA
jgi:hypothetical protein